MKRFFVSLCMALGLMAGARAVAAEGDEAVKPIACQSSSCCSNYTQCCRTWGIVAGVEGTFLKPNITGDNMTLTAPGLTGESSSLANFSEAQGAPRIWLGFENENGLGIRTRYWDFAANAVGDTFSPGSPPLFINAQIGRAALELQAYTFDLEVYKHFCGEVWDVFATGGIRYAYRDINDEFYFHDRESNWTTFTSLQNQAGGTGLTGALELARRVGDSNFSLFGNVRGSVLWGTNQNRYIGLTNDSGANTMQAYLLDESATTTIFELQLGVRWERPIKCVCANVFSTLAFEYQSWDTDGCAGYDFSQTVTGATISGHSLGDKVEFAGIAWAIGIKH